MRQLMETDIRFRRIFDAHQRAIQLYCGRRLHAGDAAVAVSDVFIVTWKRIGDVPNEPDTLPWLYGVARNVIRNHERSRRRRNRLNAKAASQTVVPASSPEVPVVVREEHRLVHQALATLKDDDQQLLTLHAWEDLNAKQIGIALGITTDAAHMRLNRARQRLARALTLIGYDPDQTDYPRAVEGGG